MTEAIINESAEQFSKRLKLPFTDYFLLARALTHRSYLNENRDAIEDNERLEFLGDAVLDFMVAEWLYNHFPEKKEGDLTRLRAALVHTDQLANFARKINLGAALRLGKGEIQAGGQDRTTLLCDAFEALIGALYLYGGLSSVKTFIEPLLNEVVDDIFQNHMDEDTKSRLQEWAQGHGFSAPKYILVAEQGPDHKKTFEMEVRIENKPFGRGTGSNKQSAEKSAAREALVDLGILEHN
ncbi:MAG: ribonuclease III [Chloroflexi bacterium]|nr:ribonuclease III [Chloroflexota bacterium]